MISSRKDVKGTMRILFTSAGRRVELMQAFHAAAERLGEPLLLYGADITPSAPALYFCDRSVMVPRIKDPAYIPELLRICREEKIDCLIPTIDTDLLLLAEQKGAFEAVGTKVLIARPEKVRLCRDKNLTAGYFHSLGLRSPDPVNSLDAFDAAVAAGKMAFPAFIKPKDGSSSIDAYRVTSREDLQVYAEKIGDYIIQPFIDGTEYTIDIFCDYDGAPVYITPRVRLAVRAGEVLKTKIAQDPQLIEDMKVLTADFKPAGQITVQLIRETATGDPYYIEINPRFGGGAPLTMKAGADSAEAVIRMIRGEKLTFVPDAAEDGAVYSRFDQSIRVEEG